MIHTSSHLYGLPTIGLRYFTIYGPWGRPDTSPWLFTSAILKNWPIDVFDDSKIQSACTCVEAVAEGIVRVLDRIPQSNPEFSTDTPDPGSSYAPYKVYKIGNHLPVELMTFIDTIEKVLGKDAKRNFLPMQPGDVVATYADIEDIKRDVAFEPKTELADGITRWVAWYHSFKTKRLE